MLGRWVCTVTVIVVRRVHRVGHTIKALLRPARTVTALAGAAAIDALRPPLPRPVGGEFVGIRDIVRSSGPVSRESPRSCRDGMSKACS